VFVKVHIQRIKKLAFCQGCQTLKNSQGKTGTSKKRREGGGVPIPPPAQDQVSICTLLTAN
jgi:hypothetical protein